MTRRLRLMYVDDEADIREVVEFALEDEADIELGLLDGGQAALEALAAELPDLIVLDVMMPGMDGPALLRRIRDTGVAVPVAFMTAKVQPQDVAFLTSLGAVGVIEKPFDPITVGQQIRELWHRHEGASCASTSSPHAAVPTNR